MNFDYYSADTSVLHYQFPPMILVVWEIQSRDKTG